MRAMGTDNRGCCCARRMFDILTKEGWGGVAERLIRCWLIVFYAATLRSMLRDAGTEQLIDFVFNRTHSLLAPCQDRDEIRRFINIVRGMKPSVVVEIGTWGGGTLFLLARSAAPGATIVSVDLPHGAFGGGYPLVKVPLYKSFAAASQKIHLIRGDSHGAATAAKVRALLPGEIDVLYIDGDHTYEGVRRDFELYGSLVKKGGIVAFHDIVENRDDPSCGVAAFWDGIKRRFRHVEIIRDRKQGKLGIGVLFMEKDGG